MSKATLKLDIWTDKGATPLPCDHSDLAECFAPHLGHVAEMVEQGYQAGEIVDERFSGWWTICNVED